MRLTRRATTRRRFLAGGSAAMVAAGARADWAGAVYASDGPERRDVRLGIIALTDCSSIVMAHELGLFRKHGIESTISKEPSWAVVRDRLSVGANQATHMLLGIPYAATLGLGGSPVKPMIIPCYLNRNGQAITLTRALRERGVRTPAQLRPVAAQANARGAPLRFAITYPTGTHAMWTRYWLASGGIHPDRDVSLITIPPAQMVANMKVGKIDGFCVGEPWHARAISDGIGFTAVTTQQLWPDHPEKVLAFTEEFADRHPRTVKAVIRAIVEASRWIDRLENRPRMAEVISRVQYVNCPKELILGRLLGEYDYGDGRKEQDPRSMTFFDRHANFPLKSHGVWWLSQFRRWGMLRQPPDYRAVVDRVHRPDIFRDVAQELGLATPAADLKTETLFDGLTFDPAAPERYAAGFAVHSMV